MYRGGGSADFWVITSHWRRRRYAVITDADADLAPYAAGRFQPRRRKPVLVWPFYTERLENATLAA